MGYWVSIPRGIVFSNNLTSEDKVLWAILSEKLNPSGYCTISNDELSKILNVSSKTITTRLSSLKEKRYINIIINSRKHQRRIYLTPPNPTSYNESQGASNREIEEKKKRIQESLKKAIVFGELPFEVLVQKLLESPYLQEVKDNNVQFLLNDKQRDFLNWFIKTGKMIDCQIAYYGNIDYSKLKIKILESDFILNNKNLNLKWILKNSCEIIRDKYKNYKVEYDKNFKCRDYNQEYSNSLFQQVDDIVI